ncbi:hypothetical protein BDW59DRAFT_140985 [Aspergillus cavernicola]|uniref:Tetraspanin Tsp3 n=1 Tax=Aspergillus cavernicola TaxID=176166 RepID=A0ABR4IRQ4_9EURO
MSPNCDSSAGIYTCLLLTLTISLVIAALSWSHTTTLSLPLPTWIPAITTFLPFVTLLTLTSIRIFSQKTWAQYLGLLNHLHTILTTAIATLALAYLFPEAILSCHLEQQWQSFFQQKNSHAIRSIQDRFQCCGLRSIHDRAWPFKDREHGDNACEVQLGYRRSCLEPWAGMQRNTSWMVVGAVVLVLVVKIGFVQVSRQRTSWMRTHFLSNGQDRQRISGPELEEGDGEPEANGESRRTLLPQSRPGQENVWDVD